MLSAEPAILLHFETVRVVLLVLHCVVVSLLAFVASQSDFYTHCRHLLKFLPPCIPAAIKDLEDAETTMGVIRRRKRAHKKRPLFHR